MAYTNGAIDCDGTFQEILTASGQIQNQSSFVLDIWPDSSDPNSSTIYPFTVQPNQMLYVEVPTGETLYARSRNPDNTARHDIAVKEA